MSLSADRETHFRSGDKYVEDAAASKDFYKGAIVFLDSSGNAEPATEAVGKVIAGISQEHKTSSAVAGDSTIEVKQGVAFLKNSATHTLTKAHIGDTVYAEDDETVGSSSAGRSAVGVLAAVDTNGVWVYIGKLPTTGLLAANNLSDVGSAATARTNLGLGTGDSPTFTDVTTSDDVTVGDDLTVTGLATIGETLEVTGITTAAAGLLLASSGNMLLKSTRVAVTAAQIKALHGTPITLVAAVASKVHMFLGAFLFLDYGSETLAEPSAPDEPVIRYKDGSGTMVSTEPDAGQIIVATADKYATAIPIAVEGGIAGARVNVPLVIHNTGGEYTGNASNDSVLYVTVFYAEVTP